MANQGLGKTLHREHNKYITDALKSFEKGLKDGDLFTPEDFDGQMEQIVDNFLQDMEDNDAPNVDLWRERLQDRIDEKRQIFEEKYPGIFEDVEYVEDADDDSDIEDEDVGIPDDAIGGYIDINGMSYEVATDDDIRAYRAKGYVRRSVTLPSYDELVEYAKDIPYIMGIELIYNGGYFEGFTVWIEYN